MVLSKATDILLIFSVLAFTGSQIHDLGVAIALFFSLSQWKESHMGEYLNTCPI